MTTHQCLACGDCVVYDSAQMGGGLCRCAPFPPSLVRIGSAEWERWHAMEKAAAEQRAKPLDEAQVERDVIDLFGPKETR